MTSTASTKTRLSLPFTFKTQKERKDVPAAIARQWTEMSHFFFFHNGLIDRSSIARFLKAQSMQRLDEIAFAFDIEALDLIQERERKEGVPLQEHHRDAIIGAILDSITQ